MIKYLFKIGSVIIITIVTDFRNSVSVMLSNYLLNIIIIL